MSLTKIVKKEKVEPIERKGSYEIKNGRPMIYSQKSDRYIPLVSGNPEGEIQRYNVGMGPGSWY